jgi:sortase A
MVPTSKPLALLIGALGLGLLAYASYLPSKALVAQVLLRLAWSEARASGASVRPWPSADTSPVARLRFDRLAVDQVILAGASGRTLAFAPGWVEGTMRPGQTGNVVLSGHRDTHFAWLAELVRGDPLELEAVDGSVRRYRVADIDVHHVSETWLLDRSAADRLVLLTCYPFDALNPGTPWRYVVTAYPEPASVSRLAPARYCSGSRRFKRSVLE